jgi:hypothetical protein
MLRKTPGELVLELENQELRRQITLLERKLCAVGASFSYMEELRGPPPVLEAGASLPKNYKLVSHATAQFMESDGAWAVKAVARGGGGRPDLGVGYYVSDQSLWGFRSTNSVMDLMALQLDDVSHRLAVALNEEKKRGRCPRNAEDKS